MNESGKCLRCGGRDGERRDGTPAMVCILRAGADYCYRCEGELQGQAIARSIVMGWEQETVALIRAANIMAETPMPKLRP
jgi:hypothetical protein